MTIEAKPLFRPDVLRSHLAGFELPARVDELRPKLKHWADLLASDKVKIRDSATGIVTNSIIQVQSKATEQQFQAETVACSPQQMLQPLVLLLQVLQPLGLFGLHPAVLGSPAVERLFADLQALARLAIVLPADSMASASRSLLMICSGLWCFFGIESLLALPGLLGLSYHMDQFLGSRPRRTTHAFGSKSSAA